MKAAMAVVGLLAAATAAPPVSSPAATDTAAVEQAEHAWMQAMRDRDAVALDRLVDSRFTLAGLDDLDRPSVPRSAWLENTLHHLRVQRTAFRRLKVGVFGDVAIARSTFTWAGSFDTEAFDDTSVLVDTWVRTSAGWRVVSRLVGDAPSASEAPAKQ